MEMSWNKILKIAECKVAFCAARDCAHNEKGQCTLEYISVGAKGECSKYKKDSEYTRGQQSFIDRATRTLNEEKEGRQ
jgi:hypothetical protein